MGSLEEDVLVQMVQDFIESGSTSATISTPSISHSLHNPTQYFILQDILRSEDHTTETEAKVMKYVMKLMRHKQGYEKTSVIRCLVTRIRNHGLNASLCQTSWAISLGCPSGEYEYIEVKIEDEKNGESVRLLVDIDFKSQFELARPTEHYKELTDLLPVIFVGTENKLCKIISLLCSAAKQSLRENGLHVPPWRTTRYMQSKYLSVLRKEPGPDDDDDNNNNNNNIVVPIMVKPKKRELGGDQSGLSKMRINCC